MNAMKERLQFCYNDLIERERSGLSVLLFPNQAKTTNRRAPMSVSEQPSFDAELLATS